MFFPFQQNDNVRTLSTYTAVDGTVTCFYIHIWVLLFFPTFDTFPPHFSLKSKSSSTDFTHQSLFRDLGVLLSTTAYIGKKKSSMPFVAPEGTAWKCINSLKKLSQVQSLESAPGFTNAKVVLLERSDLYSWILILLEANGPRLL